MTDNLAELKERVELCRQKSMALTSQINVLAGQSVNVWVTPLGPNSGLVKAKLLAHPPVSIRSELGMIVNELRSVLDALACELAIRNGANDTSAVYFPITKTKAGFFEQTGRRKIRKLSAADQQKIESLKPWQAPEHDPEDGHPNLFMLHEADRVRKHQKLLKWACMGGAFPAGKGEIGFMDINSVFFEEAGKEETLSTFRNVTCQLGVRIDLVYAEPPALRGQSVDGLLKEFCDSVSGIVAAFE
jgi:hypothetical protein